MAKTQLTPTCAHLTYVNKYIQIHTSCEIRHFFWLTELIQKNAWYLDYVLNDPFFTFTNTIQGDSTGSSHETQWGAGKNCSW
jgi:hypothetical protein